MTIRGKATQDRTYLPHLALKGEYIFFLFLFIRYTFIIYIGYFLFRHMFYGGLNVTKFTNT